MYQVDKAYVTCKAHSLVAPLLQASSIEGVYPSMFGALSMECRVHPL